MMSRVFSVPKEPLALTFSSAMEQHVANIVSPANVPTVVAL